MRIELKDIDKIPKRAEESHKGTFGKILNIAGSKFYPGAAILSSLSALKVGAGYVTLACPDFIIPSVSSYSPDITFLPLKSDSIGIKKINVKTILEKSQNYDVISIGSGLSSNVNTKKFVTEFFKQVKKPVIIDADGLNAISQDPRLPKNTVITPHPKELSRLINIPMKEIMEQKEHFAVFTAKKYNCIVVLKGHETVVTDGEKIYINSTGNSALAKAGTGDVLTGIISGIYAQNKNLLSAAVNGVYIHGLAADIASEHLTEYGMLASELISYIPAAIKKYFEIL